TDTRNMQVFPSKEDAENRVVSEILEIVDENIYERLSVSSICESLSYSRSYVSKVFKNATGYSPLEYILKKKIREAKKLIRDDKYSFTQISEILAFDNSHYFSTVFKRVTNMSPSEYKNSVSSRQQ
ncbi:MAG: helix-turn-helix transcriptional regulator, partial [Clostridia bacterium]|nr:helix-turn-helix transcriptional regulator [Clostridia bacterium]